MIIQYASDLHLEFETELQNFENIIKPINLNRNSNVLILAGDISTTQHLPVLIRFLKYCKLNWRTVVYIPGNHEYYYSSFDEANKILSSVCEQEGVIFALEKVIKFKLRTNPNSSSSDYKLVTIICTNSKQFILDTIRYTQKSEENIIIVATYHTPLDSFEKPQYENNELNIDVYSEYSYLMSYIDYFIYGYTHFNAELFGVVNKSATLILSNERYYTGSGKFYSPTANIIL